MAFGGDAFGRELLAKTAQVGGGVFLLPEDVELLADEILASGGSAVAVPALTTPGRLALVLLLVVGSSRALRGRAWARA